MKEDLTAGVTVGCVIGIIGVIISSFGVYNASETRWKNDAVKHDKAEYYLDQNHERQWRWKD